LAPHAEPGSGRVTASVVLDLGEKLINLAGGVNLHEPLERPSPFPANRPHRRLRKPVHAPDTDPRVPFRLQTPRSGDISPDVGLRQVGEQRHTQEISPPTLPETPRSRKAWRPALWLAFN
jgi:hypothetical protein